MHDILVVLVHSIVTMVRLLKPGGLRAVVAESALTRHQLLILNRSRKRAPSLRVSDRMIAGLCTLLMHPSRMLRCGIVLKPSTLLHFHHLLTKRKYHMLFSSKRRGRPGPKGPAQELIDAVVEMKRRNPTWGCPRIAQQITLAFGVDIDKDVVRRILGKHYGLESGSGGPSWLTFLGQAKDSLWSIDLFRCESLSLRTHWVLVVMDQFTRRIIGFGIHRGTVDGPSLCSMLQRAIQGQALPKYLSTDNDPLYRFHQWQAKLRVLEVMAIKTVPYVPLSRAPQRRSITSGGRTHPRRLLVELGSLRVPEPGNRLGRSLAIKLTYGKCATLQAVTRVKLEQASKVTMWTPTRRESGEGCKDREESRAGTRNSPTNEHLIRSTGVWSTVCGEGDLRSVREARDWLGVAAPNVVRKGGGQSGSRRGPYDL